MSKADSAASGAPPKKPRLGLAEKVLIGLGLGIAVGVFFGEQAGFLKVGG